MLALGFLKLSLGNEDDVLQHQGFLNFFVLKSTLKSFCFLEC